MDTFKKLDFLIPIFRILPLWLKILAILWIILSIIIVCIILYFYYKDNQNKFFRENKQTAIKLIRVYEDYDESLDKSYKKYIEKVDLKTADFSRRNMALSSVHGKSQGKLFKEYYDLIEDKTKKLKRLEENYLFNRGYNSLEEINELTKEDKENLISKQRSSQEKRKTIINNMKKVVDSVWHTIRLNDKIINSFKKQFFPTDSQE